MKVIKFECKSKQTMSGKEICLIIENVTQWVEYKGYGILPGIEKAQYNVKTDNMIGSEILVSNTDGSKHIEEIMEWENGKFVAMKMHGFVFPLNKLATHFTEEWHFSSKDSSTEVIRIFKLYPLNLLARPFLWGISLLLKKSISIQLIEMAKNN